MQADKAGPKGSSQLDLDCLAAMITERPTAYPSELAVPLGVSKATVCRGLKALKITRKKSMIYREKDDTRRKEFIEPIETIPIQTMAYLDESGLDEAMQREYGYAAIRKRLAGEVRGKRFAQRHRIIAGLLCGNALAPLGV